MKRTYGCKVCGYDGTHLLKGLGFLGWAARIDHPTVPKRCTNCGRAPFQTIMVPDAARTAIAQAKGEDHA